MAFKNLTGKKFGRLTVIKYAGKYKSPKGNSMASLWLCRCDCGKETISYAGSLGAGTKKSCGCLKNENIRPRYRESHPQWSGYGEITGTLWNRIIRNAKIKKIPLEITIKYIWNLFEKQKGKCSLTGEHLYLAKSSEELESGKNTASLDRIDSSKGYIEGNVQWVHRDINYMKQQYKQDEFIEWCKKITKYTGKEI